MISQQLLQDIQLGSAAGIFYRSRAKPWLPPAKPCINILQEPESSPRSLNRPGKEQDRARIVSSGPQMEKQAEEEVVCQKSMCATGVTTRSSKSQPNAFKEPQILSTRVTEREDNI